MLPTNWLPAYFTTVLYIVSILLRLFVGLALSGPRMYADSHWRYHTFERYYSCSCSKLRHQISKGMKMSLQIPLKNGIVTFYENFTNKYGRVDKIGGDIHVPPGYLGYLRHNFLMAWAIITICTFKCV